MIQSTLIGMLLAAGVWLVVRGWFPAPATLSERLADFSDVSIDVNDHTGLRSLWGRGAVALLRAVPAAAAAPAEAAHAKALLKRWPQCGHWMATAAILESCPGRHSKRRPCGLDAMRRCGQVEEYF